MNLTRNNENLKNNGLYEKSVTNNKLLVILKKTKKKVHTVFVFI